jgi:hypothetical protein
MKNTLARIMLFIMALLIMTSFYSPVDVHGMTGTTSTTINPYHVWTTFGNGVNSYIWSIYVDGSDVYVSGSFIDIGGVPGATGIARWDGSAWHAMGSGILNGVGTMIRVGSWLYVGGAFLNAGGVADADYIARWDGSTWSSLGGNQLNTMVFALASDGTNLYVGGQFTNAAGIASADNVAIWNGTSWAALGSGLPSPVTSLVFYNGQLHASGQWPNLSRFDGINWNTIPGISGPYSNIYMEVIGMRWETV